MSDQENINPDPVIVENANTNILNNTDYYLQYIRDNINQIIQDDNLQYSDPMDKKKIYPAFTYTQFLYLLSRLYDRVYSVNLELLYDVYNNKYNKIYNPVKVEKAYNIYFKLCQYYGYTCSMEPFQYMTGVDLDTLNKWLTSGRSVLLNIMRKNAKNTTISGFENSNTPLLRLAAANYKYNLNNYEKERESGAVLESLPDLLQISQQKNDLPGSQKVNCT